MPDPERQIWLVLAYRLILVFKLLITKLKSVEVHRLAVKKRLWVSILGRGQDWENQIKMEKRDDCYRILFLLSKGVLCLCYITLMM